MAKVCRVGDTGSGTCFLHGTPQAYTTTFIANDSVVTNQGTQVIRVGDIGNASCGHQTIATTGSGTSGADGKAFHRTGDVGHIIGSEASTYTANEGSSNWEAS